MAFFTGLPFHVSGFKFHAFTRLRYPITILLWPSTLDPRQLTSLIFNHRLHLKDSDNRSRGSKFESAGARAGAGNRVHPQIMCIGNWIGNESSRLRRKNYTTKLTTNPHLSEKPNGAFRQYCQRERKPERTAAERRCPGRVRWRSLQARLRGPLPHATEEWPAIPASLIKIPARTAGICRGHCPRHPLLQ